MSVRATASHVLSVLRYMPKCTHVHASISVAMHNIHTQLSVCCFCRVQYLDSERLSAAQYNPASLRALIIPVEQ
jgi:hypothetical protein